MDDIIFFKNQDEFHQWLEKHHGEAKEVWVGFHRKHTDRETLTWSESVDAALCFGWIDGIRKSIDSERYRIRFTRRKLSSVWSAVNVKKVKTLIEQGKMKPEGMHAYTNRKDSQGYSADQRNVQLAPEYEEQIRANKKAWEFFSNLARSYKRDSIWWIMSAKREETRLRRLGILIDSSEEGLKIPSLRKKK